MKRKYYSLLIYTLLVSCGADSNNGELDKENIPKNRVDTLEHVLTISNCDSLYLDSIFLSSYQIKLDSSSPVPKSVLESIQLLDTSMNDVAKHAFRICEPIKFHFGFGTWIRNNWGIWQEGKLVQNYDSIFILLHPDDVSGDILELYHAYLQKDSIELIKFFNSRLDYEHLQDSTHQNALLKLKHDIMNLRE